MTPLQIARLRVAAEDSADLAIDYANEVLNWEHPTTAIDQRMEFHDRARRWARQAEDHWTAVALATLGWLLR